MYIKNIYINTHIYKIIINIYILYIYTHVYTQQLKHTGEGKTKIF